MSQQTRKYCYDFRGAIGLAASGSGAGSPFVKADTSSAGSPTVGGANGGGLELAFDNTSEAQNLCVFMDDVLPFDIDDIIRAEFVVKTVAALDSATSLAFGLASARNDAIDSIAQSALFRCIGSNAVVVETDDGTNNNDDVATGLTLGATFKRFAIDFKSGIQTREAPLLSLGGKAAVQFFGGNSLGSLRRVASGTVFDMNNYSSGLQLFFQLQKTADTNTDSMTILEASVEVQLPNA